MRQSESNRELRDDPDQRERPDNNEKCPTPGTAQRAERKGSVGARDK